MKITKITLNGQSHYNYGPDCTEADAAGYRSWIRAQLEAEFPGAEIDINEPDATYGIRVEVADEADYDAANEAVCQFCEDAWNRCPWDWANA